MRTDKFTVKTQEAIAAAQASAERQGQQAVDVEHVLVALLQQPEGAVVPIVQKIGADPAAIARELEAGIGRLPKVSGGLTEQTYVTPRLAKVFDAAQREADTLKDAYIAGEHLLLAMTDAGGAAARVLKAAGVTREAVFQAMQAVRGTPARHRPEPRGEVPGAEEVRPRPDRAGAQGQARPGDRPRRGDPPRDAGALAPHQEQPGADRRAGRRQDRHRRGAGAAHRRRRRARER